jgi:hypothetical protein
MQAALILILFLFVLVSSVYIAELNLLLHAPQQIISSSIITVLKADVLRGSESLDSLIINGLRLLVKAAIIK